MRTIVILGFVFCFGCLITSCAPLTAFLDKHLSDAETTSDTRAAKRVPLPPTVRDFGVEPPEP
jgi:hypothetical protein